MPTFYEGGPIETISQNLCEQDYAEAYYIEKSIISPIHTKWVKTGLCLSAAVVIGSLLPFYRAKFFTLWVPSCAFIISLVLAFFFVFVQPRDIKKWGAKIYCSGALSALPQKIEIYRDSVIIENEYEKILEYWTDFAKCVETSSHFILTGGRERSLLIIKKEGLTPQQTEKISRHFSNEFASRYLKKKR